MGISVGNLHYHYANKIKVILELQQDFIQKTDTIATKLSHASVDMASMQEVLTETFTLIYDYRFLFNERLLLSRKVPEVELMFKEMLVTRKKEFDGQVSWLKTNRLIRQDLPDQQYHFLFDHIVILYNSWTAHISLFNKSASDHHDMIQSYAEMIGALWTPYFTPAGLEYFTNQP